MEVPASSVDNFSAGWTNCMSPMYMVEQSHTNPYSIYM